MPEPDRDTARVVDQFIEEYRGKVDESLILLIAGDYGIEARAVLDGLAESSAMEEASTLEVVSAHSSQNLVDMKSDPDTVSSHTTHQETPLSSRSNLTLQDLTWEARPRSERSHESTAQEVYSGLASLSDSEKKANLQEMFPSLKEHDIAFALKRSKGDVGKAVEDLQTIQYLEETGQRKKGVDGFFQQHDGVTRKKGKKPRSKMHLSSSSDNSSSAFSRGEVGSVSGPDSPSLPWKIEVDQLSSRLEEVSTEARTRLAVNYTLAPSNDLIDDGSTKAPAKKSPLDDAFLLPEETQPPIGQPRNYNEATQQAAQSRAAASKLYASASEAFKKGRSDPLFRQVAGYYAENAREHNRQAHLASGAAADYLVDEQSRPGHIDLHGVTALDGARIARARVKAWWDNLGEYRLQKAKEGFVIVTGKGSHSVGGVSRLRHAVHATLNADGWKVEPESAQLTVLGKKQKA